MSWFSRAPAQKNDHARQLVARGALLLDVRTPVEYSGGHIEGALNIPVQELGKRVSELGPPSRPVVVYCRSGGRSCAAAEILSKAGYEVVDVGGMSAY
ncbi:MAG: rhodanese-like domain-containing protein [Sandaracinaceae bacterium]|nr:rhodanese-like domain-containing protein [Sandaracinaceae bacterium]